MRSALVLDGRFRVFEDGSINRIVDGVETPARTFSMGRSDAKSKYVAVSYREDGKQKLATVHRLMAFAFLPNPDNRPEVSHIDGNKANNNLSNLCWSTRRESTKRAYENGRMNPWKNGTPCIFCGDMTRSTISCCPKCQLKHEVVSKRIEKAKRQKEKFKSIDPLILTHRENECVSRAKNGARVVDIARELGISRQRVDQALDNALGKQERWEARERQA